jgi:hypothetical protein
MIAPNDPISQKAGANGLTASRRSFKGYSSPTELLFCPIEIQWGCF